MIEDLESAVESGRNLLKLLQFYVPEFRTIPTAPSAAQDKAGKSSPGPVPGIDSDSHFGTKVVLH